MNEKSANMMALLAIPPSYGLLISTSPYFDHNEKNVIRNKKASNAENYYIFFIGSVFQINLKFEKKYIEIFNVLKLRISKY